MSTEMNKNGLKNTNSVLKEGGVIPCGIQVLSDIKILDIPSLKCISEKIYNGPVLPCNV